MTFLVGAIETGVGPLGEQGLDEALSLTVGLRPVRTNEFVAELEGVQDLLEGPRDGVTSRTVGHHALDVDSLLGEERRGGQ